LRMRKSVRDTRSGPPPARTCASLAALRFELARYSDLDQRFGSIGRLLPIGARWGWGVWGWGRGRWKRHRNHWASASELLATMMPSGKPIIRGGGGLPDCRFKGSGGKKECGRRFHRRQSVGRRRAGRFRGNWLGGGRKRG
jgi:hypothetical protein